MNIKGMLITMIGSTVLLSSVGNAVTLGSGSIYEKKTDNNFHYTDSNCKKEGFNLGMVVIDGQKFCTRKQDQKVSNLKTTSSKTWSKTSETTDYLFCNKNSSSCSQSLASGKNSCVSTGVSSTKSSTYTSSVGAEFKKLGVSLGASRSSTKSYTKSSGTNICVTSDLRQTCSVGAKRKVRLKHNLIMQHFKGDGAVTGWRVRRENTVYKSNGKVYRYGKWARHSSKTKKGKGNVEMNLPVRRNSICDAKKI